MHSVRLFACDVVVAEEREAFVVTVVCALALSLLPNMLFMNAMLRSAATRVVMS